MSRKISRKSISLMALSVCILVFAGLWYEGYRQQNRYEIVQTQGTSEAASETSPPAKTIEKIPIYLVGEVQKPGIYKIEPGAYLYELIEMAGGLTPDAAKEDINLVLRLTENQQLYIPSHEEVSQNPALLPQPKPDASEQRIDLNVADPSELETLPGIGPVTAQAIVDYREENGPFAVPEDLMQVPGIKEGRFAALEEFIFVSDRR